MEQLTTNPNAKKPKEVFFLVGYIGHKAEKLQALFPGYSFEPNENGYFLRFEDTTAVGNEGVIAYTNCFSKKHLKKMLFSKLLFAI